MGKHTARDRQCEIIKDLVCQAKEFELYSEGYVEPQKDVKLESDK